ncbi:MAG: sporulation protein YunB [Clostridia bacterium]|nr:sporulation protein YunB [Clostridia bacterium]
MVKFYFKPRFKRPPPVKARRLFYKKGAQALLFRGACVVLVMSIITVLMDMKMRPIIETVGGTALKNSLSNVLDGAVNEMVDDLGVRYEDMVEIQKDANGNIVAIKLNSTAINGYKTEISDGCSDRLGDFTETTVPIPLGSLIGGSFFNGKGFCINVDATIYGFAVTDVVSEFESAGINQTRHRIYLNVQASAHAYMGLCHLNESVDETIILVETIIVGEVPQTYYIRDK